MGINTHVTAAHAVGDLANSFRDVFLLFSCHSGQLPTYKATFSRNVCVWVGRFVVSCGCGLSSVASVLGQPLVVCMQLPHVPLLGLVLLQ